MCTVPKVASQASEHYTAFEQPWPGPKLLVSIHMPAF